MEEQDMVEAPAEAPEMVDTQDMPGCDPADVAPVFDIDWEGRRA